MPHPIERLRWVARAEGAGPTLLGEEAAMALAVLGDDLPGLVTGCRRLIDRHPAAGTLWWVAARMLASGSPSSEAWAAAHDLESDPTAGVVAAHLPDDATVTVVGWPEQASEALRRRGDLEVLVVDCNGEGRGLARQLPDAVVVPDAGLGAAVRASSLVLLEASALGVDGVVALPGSAAAAATAAQSGIDVWVVAGVGRVLPVRLWQAVVARLGDAGEPWEAPGDVVPLPWVTTVVGPAGAEPASDAPKRADCPVVPELLGWGS